MVEAAVKKGSVFMPVRVVAALGVLRKIVRERVRICALRGVRISLEGDRLRIEGTDLQTSVVYDTETEELFDLPDFSVVVQLEDLWNAVRRCTRGFRLDIYDDRADVTVDREPTHLGVAEGADFPAMPGPSPVRAAASTAPAILASGVAFASGFSTNGTRDEVLDSVSVAIDAAQGLAIAGTDGFQLGVAQLESEVATWSRRESATIPHSAMDVLRGLAAEADGRVDVELGDTHGQIRWCEFAMRFRLRPAPPWQRALPDGTADASAIVDASALLNVLGAKGGVVTLVAGEGALTVSGGRRQRHTLVAKVQGAFDDVRIDRSRLQLIAKHAGEEISVHVRAGATPIVLEAAQPQATRFYGVIMPRVPVDVGDATRPQDVDA